MPGWLAACWLLLWLAGYWRSERPQKAFAVRGRRRNTQQETAEGVRSKRPQEASAARVRRRRPQPAAAEGRRRNRMQREFAAGRIASFGRKSA